MSRIEHLADQGLIRPPGWLPRNVMYETIMGSVAYGVSGDSSDMDIYGFAIPPKDDLFPHLRGEIPGFGTPSRRFEQFEAYHIVDPNALGAAGRNHDLTIYSIVKFFQLAMENNPNIIDSLYTPATCVLHCTAVGSLVRERRRLFLHKGCWPKFKGYAYAQLHKIANKRPVGKRSALVEDYGYDVKFAYHVVRLLGEAEMILVEEDLDLQRDRERLKAIRRGEWTLERIQAWCAEKEGQLERAYAASRLRPVPDEDALRRLLLECLEAHYGNLSGCVEDPGRALVALKNIDHELDRVRDLL